MKRVSRLAAFALAGTVALAGCASIPMEGSVELARHVEQDREQGVRYFPAGPLTGGSREEIVQGFLDAGAGVQDDFAVARQFLATESADQWRPEQRTIVAGGQASMKTLATNLVEVTLQSYGEVDAAGNYTFYVQPKSVTLQFKLAQIDGEWRIQEAPDAIVLQRQAFVDLFHSLTLEYFDSQFTYTTGDLRWVMTNRDEATRATQLLLEGPNQWLAQGGAVRSAIPAQVRLLEPVRTDGNTAIVNLSDEISHMPPDQLSLVRLQLEQTLKPVLEVGTVEIRVNGAKLDVQLPQPGRVLLETEVKSAPLVAQGQQVGYLYGTELREPQGAANVESVVVDQKVIRGALSLSRQTAALLTKDATLAMRFADTEPQLIDTRPGQIEPSLDNWDYVWTQSTEQPGLWVTKIGETYSEEIALPEGVRDDFISFQPSRDGVRMAFLYKDDDRVVLAISPIQRDEAGTPVGFGEPLLLKMPGAAAADVAWVDRNTVAMLVDVPDGSTDVRIYRVGGELTSLGTIQDAVQVAGSNSLAGMRIIDRNGTLYASRGTGWRSNAATVSFLFAQE